MKLLITGALQKDEKLFDEIRQIGHEVTFVQDERIPLKDQHIDPADFEGVICNGLFLYNDISEFSNLRYIQLTSAGYDRMPMDYIREHNIEIHNAKGVYSIPMAEFAVGGVLALYKKLRLFAENQKQHKWEKQRDLLELYGKTVCIVGCGDVGQECAKRFAAFGCRVLGVNRTVKELPNFEKILPLDELSEVLPQCDVVLLTIALSEETRHLMGEEHFAALKPGAVLCMVSRGAVADPAELINWLKSETSGGAVLDVFEEEPVAPDSPLWDMEKVIITPHNSYAGDGVAERLKAVLLFSIGDIK